jgi:hypothetical protein
MPGQAIHDGEDDPCCEKQQDCTDHCTHVCSVEMLLDRMQRSFKLRDYFPDILALPYISQLVPDCQRHDATADVVTGKLSQKFQGSWQPACAALA